MDLKNKEGKLYQQVHSCLDKRGITVGDGECYVLRLFIYVYMLYV